MTQDDDFWNAFREKFNNGRVIPIFSNSFFINRLFTKAANAPSPDNYDEIIAKSWADKTGYPFRDHYDLAEVAQYDIFRRFSTEEYTDIAKVIMDGYLSILKEQLTENLRINDQTTYRYASEHRFWPESTISDFCKEVNIPKVPGESLQAMIESSCILYLINSGKVNGYMTTCYFDILEQAIRLLKKPYYTNYYGNQHGQEYVNERGETTLAGEFYDPERSDIAYVYHIFGHEKQPDSMVMSEDDHINFLIKIKQYQESSKEIKPFIPEFIAAEIKNKTLLFLGYRWQDWEFRTIFRWIVGTKDEERERYSRKKASVVVQFQPGPKELLTDNDVIQAAHDYLNKYFAHCNLDIQWEDSEAFFCKLLQE
jgi:SIR2-like domain